MLKGKNILGYTLVLSLLSLGYSNSAQAFNITFDWNDFTYTAGSIDPVTYSDIQGSGIDLTIDVGGDTSGFVVGPAGNDSPSIDSGFTGGQGTSEQSFSLGMNQSSASSFITIDFSFSAPVNNVSFDIFDIDTAGDNNKTSDTSFVDLVQIIGELSGSSVTPTLTATNSNFVSVDSNNAFGLDAVDQNSADATVTSSFTQDIDYFQITYGNNTSFGRNNEQLGTSNPGQQGIGIYDVQFTQEVPFKFSPALGMFLVGIVVGGNKLRKRHKM